MARKNNVDTAKVQQFEETIRRDPSEARKTQVIEGEWLVEDGAVQYPLNHWI